MMERFSRTEMLLGEQAMRSLAEARIAVFGLGGVGGYVCEALARSGVGAMDLIDHDKVSLSNLNRQILATEETVGAYKVDVAAERVHAINPDCAVRAIQTFYLPETAPQFDFASYSYIVDAIDTVSGKIQLVLAARTAGKPIISAMGAGNKLDPTAFRVADIYETSVCPLARIMRRELKRRGVEHLKVVYSTEKPHPLHGTQPDSSANTESGRYQKPVPGSVSFVPAVMGLIIAGEVIRDLTGNSR